MLLDAAIGTQFNKELQVDIGIESVRNSLRPRTPKTPSHYKSRGQLTRSRVHRPLKRETAQIHLRQDTTTPGGLARDE